MTELFKQKNSGNTLVLLVYGLILKFSIFLHPAGPLTQPDDHFLFTRLVSFLAPLNMPPVIYSLLAFLLLYSQAIIFNRISNAQKTLPKPNYLVGMAYLLITSLLPEWNRFSAPLLINSFLLWIFYNLNTLYGANKPGSVIFNVGIVTGIVTLLYQPAIFYVLLLMMALFIMRPLRVREWIIGLLGVTSPYYFVGILLYLSGTFSWNKLIPRLTFSLPVLPESVFITISIGLLVLPFIISGYFVQNNLSKMLIQVRKSWSLLLLFLIVAVLIIVAGNGNNYVNWLLCAVPLTAFHAAVYFYPTNRVFPQVLHWIVFLYAMYVNYWL